MHPPEMVVIKSHPVRVRGLKHQRGRDHTLDYEVAPRAGAWIETVVKV